MKWSGYFLFCFINRLNITWELICGAICGLSHCINQITSLGKCMLNDYKSPKVAIMVISIKLSYIYV